jgi:hypothetical protein
VPDPSNTHSRLREEHHKGTGRWFLESDEFNRWLDVPCGTLWMNGSGKQFSLDSSLSGEVIVRIKF